MAVGVNSCVLFSSFSVISIARLWIGRRGRRGERCCWSPNPPPLELDTAKYAGVIEDTMVVEKLLAQSGIRLAGILNYLSLENAAQTFIL